MATLTDTGKLECPDCTGRIDLHGKEPEFGNTYLCPDCHALWKILKDPILYMKMEIINPIHKCPITDFPVIKYHKNYSTKKRGG